VPTAATFYSPSRAESFASVFNRFGLVTSEFHFCWGATSGLLTKRVVIQPVIGATIHGRGCARTAKMILVDEVCCAARSPRIFGNELITGVDVNRRDVPMKTDTTGRETHTQGINGKAVTVDQAEFDKLRADYITAFQTYIAEARKTHGMLERCTAEPMPLTERFKLMFQAGAENRAHSLYLDTKRLLYEVARLGYAFCR